MLGRALMGQAFAFGGNMAYVIAAEELGAARWWISPSAAGIALLIGPAFGRPLVRLLLREFLSPRLRRAFPALWTCDGLAPPSKSGPPASR